MSNPRSRAPIAIIGLVSVGAITFTALQRYSTGNPTGRAAGATGGCAGSVEPLAELPEDLRVGPEAAVEPEAVEADGRVLVRFNQEPLEERLSALRPLRQMRLGDASILEIDAEMAEGLSDDPDVAWVEPVIAMHVSYAPDDPYFPYQWNLGMLGLSEVWATTMGSGAVVAVLDTGVSEELDGLNRVLDGWDFIDDDDDPSDEHWHGTHVAGTIAQKTDNGTGVSSVAPAASILPVRVMDENGSGDSATVAEGIVWAVDNGAHIINLSLGSSSRSEAVAEACAYAAENNVLVVAAAGNDGDNAVHHPAAIDSVIAVGAVDLNGDLTDYSNYGSEIDIVAPGGDSSVDLDGDGVPDGIKQATNLDGEWAYVLAEGTSSATPHVAGVAALLYSAGVTNAEDLADALLSSSEDLGDSGVDDLYGHGLLDPPAALALAGDYGGSSEGSSDAEDSDEDDGGSAVVVDEGSSGPANSTLGQGESGGGCQHVTALAGFGPWVWLGMLGWGMRRR